MDNNAHMSIFGESSNPPAESVSIGDAASALGISVKTLRRWEEAGKIAAIRTAGGHRRYPVNELQRFQGKEVVSRRNLVYIRASSVTMQRALEDAIGDYCSAKGWDYHALSDVGSRDRFHYNMAVSMMIEGSVGRLIVKRIDHLPVTEHLLLRQICIHCNTELVVIDTSPLDRHDLDRVVEEELRAIKKSPFIQVSS